MVKPVQLSNGRSWRTQKEALKHFKDMLARYSIGDRVSESNHHDDLVALIERYDALLSSRDQTKGGGGIEFFSKQRNVGDGWTTEGFHVHRRDGTSIDFSYIDAVKG